MVHVPEFLVDSMLMALMRGSEDRRTRIGIR